MDEEGNWHRLFERELEHKIDFKDEWKRGEVPVKTIKIQSVKNGV
jgi:hypothetical protein